MRQKRKKARPQRSVVRRITAQASTITWTTDTADLWVDIAEVPPPVQTRAQVLPLEKLSWENFERLCYRLADRMGDMVDRRRYGVAGQWQKGIDVLVRRASDGEYTTWQCKRYQKFSASTLKAAVEEFLKHDWVGRTKIFHLAVTADLSDTKLADAIEIAAAKCKKRNVEFIPLDKDRLSELLKPHPDLVDDFFDRPWVVAFCGPDAAATLGKRTLTKAKRLAARRYLREIYSTHFSLVDIGLPATASALRQATPHLPLRDRYVEPTVDAVDTVITAKATDAATNQNESDSQRGVATAEEAKSVEPPGFRTKEYRSQRALFDWLANVDLGVILGGPGLGKSAAMEFLTLDVLADKPRYEKLAKKWANRLPVFVPFAMLGRLVAAEEVINIGAFFEAWLRKLGAPADTITLLNEALEDERLLLIVDGLDEWSDQVAAASSRVMILNFAIPRHLPVIVAARPIGYERLGGFGPEWKKAELRPLDPAQQADFTRIWFEHFHRTAIAPVGSTPTVINPVRRETESFMAEIKQDPDLLELAGIPLLLSALIYLRLSGRVLPHNRFDALEEITAALIKEQPQRRAQASLQGTRILSFHSRAAERGLQFLALSIHQQPGSDSMSNQEAKDALISFYRGDELQKSLQEADELSTYQLESSPNDIGILVQRQPGQIGFLHRSIQEYLAAKEIAGWPFDNIMRFVVGKCSEPGWQDVILAVLHLIQRQNEVDAILNAIRASQAEALESPLKEILVARIIFGDIACSPDLAAMIAKDIFRKIEASPWMPLRKSLLIEAIRGLDSENLHAAVRSQLARWFPSQKRWRWSLFRTLAQNPRDGTGHKLFTCLFNSNSGAEMKEIAEAIASGQSAWPEIGDELCDVLYHPAEGDLLAAALHALCIGWPTHVKLAALLSDASKSKAETLRCVSLFHKARRGDKSTEVKQGLEDFCQRGWHIYPWEDEVIATLSENWGKDSELRLRALEAVWKRRMPTKWNDRLALRYLIRTFPGDDEVAAVLAKMMREKEYIGIDFDSDKSWEFIFNGFRAHPTIIPAAEEWLEKYGLTRYDEANIARLAMLARTDKCKRILLERLEKGQLYPQWVVSALIDLAGPDDQQVRDAFFRFIADKKRIGQVANFLPTFMDHAECREQLFLLLQNTTGFEFGHVLTGLFTLGLSESPDIVASIEKRLIADENGSLWWVAKSRLIEKYPQNITVKKAAFAELGGPDAALYAIAPAYAADDDFRPKLERIIECVHDDLRLVLVESLATFIHREDSFAKDLLGSYKEEWNGGVRTVAARAFFSWVRQNVENLDNVVTELRKEMRTTGEGFDERRQAATVALLALAKADELIDPVLNLSGATMPLTVHASDGINWPFVQAVVESWDAIRARCGERTWNLFRGLDVLLVQLARNGRRDAVAQAPDSIIQEIRRQAHFDVDSFVALSVLDQGNLSFRDFCIGLFEKMRKDPNQMMSASWGYNEVQVWFEAAQYLARNYGGEPKLGSRLEDIARHSHDPAGPIIALSCGWPASKVLDEIWTTRDKTAPLNSSPATAWLVHTKANVQELVEYLNQLPAEIQNEHWWRFPRETMRAMRNRLINDVEAQKKMLSFFGANVNVDTLASIARLSGITVRDRGALRTWALKCLAGVRKGSMLQPMGYDMLSGEARAVEFCFLEAYLTSQ